VNQRPSHEIAHCVVCGERNAEVLGDAAAFRSELEALWEYHTPRLRPETPPARLADRVSFSEAPPLRLVQCTGCGLVYRNPIERAHSVRALYSHDAPREDGLLSLHRAQLPAARAQAKRIRALLGRSGAGVEVGSYVGAFLVAANEAGLQFEGLDINPAVNAFARALGVRVREGELRDLPERAPLDALAIWNTFDQLVDPRAVVYDAWRRLALGGVLAIRVPNGAAYARLHATLAHGNRLARRAARAALAQNNLLGFPYRWGFTVGSLRRLLTDAGFLVVRVRGDVLVPTSDEWTRPWARWEERLLKRTMAGVVHAHPTWAPWLEVFATRQSSALEAA
jgi:SAM-dependent methyltransferase